MSKNTRSKTTLNEQKSKDPSIGIFSNTNERVLKTFYLEWSNIYAIFDNYDFYPITHDHTAFVKVNKSQLHHIASWPPFMPYTVPVKWELDYANHKEQYFKDHAQTSSDPNSLFPP